MTSRFSVPSSGRTPIPGTVFTTPPEHAIETSSSHLSQTNKLEIVTPSAAPAVESSEPVVQLDQTDDEIIKQILQENQPKSTPGGDGGEDDDERVWNTFNDVISQVSR
jgi:hypothetical protein